MSESKSGKTLLIVVLVLFGGGGLLLYPHLQWFRLEMAARDSISDNALALYPDSTAVLGAVDTLKASGAKFGHPQLEVRQKMEERRVGPVVMWFLIVNMSGEGKEFQTEKRIQTDWTDDELEALEEGGCVVTRLN